MTMLSRNEARVRNKQCALYVWPFLSCAPYAFDHESRLKFIKGIRIKLFFMGKQKAIFSWSGGKDSSLCLHHVLQHNTYDIQFLLTSVNGNLKRVSMHGIHESLLEAQAKSIGLPLKKVYVYEASNKEYEREMEKVLLEAKSEGIDTVIFGDIFLDDLRKYREEKLAQVAMKAVFPLWKKNTKQLISEFLRLGYKTVICCGNDAYLNKEDVGKIIDHKFIDDLASDIDPCGENGEYHTYCYEGAIFKFPIEIEVGDKIYKPLDLLHQGADKNGKTTRGFWYADINLKQT